MVVAEERMTVYSVAWTGTRSQVVSECVESNATYSTKQLSPSVSSFLTTSEMVRRGSFSLPPNWGGLMQRGTCYKHPHIVICFPSPDSTLYLLCVYVKTAIMTHPESYICQGLSTNEILLASNDHWVDFKFRRDWCNCTVCSTSCFFFFSLYFGWTVLGFLE